MRRDLPRAVARTSRAAPAAAAARPRPRAADGLPALQRAAGNRAVAGLVAARSGATVVQRYETEEHATLGAPGTRVTVAGIDMTQGEMITMGDFFTGVEQMEAHPQQVRDVLAAIRRGGAGTADWQRATGGRYLELATANQAHFGPPNAALVPVSGTSTADHRAAFVAGHSRALWESALGHPDVAQRHNSFAGHFLTDAFAAGHVVNKADVMARFAARLTDADAFLSAVAARAWAIPGVVATMSRYEENSTPLHLDFDTQGMFERFLKGVSEAKPELVPNSIAKVVHDALNGLAGDASVGGLDVANDRGDTWRLSGDGTLARSPDTQRIAARRHRGPRHDTGAHGRARRERLDVRAAPDGRRDRADRRDRRPPDRPRERGPGRRLRAAHRREPRRDRRGGHGAREDPPDPAQPAGGGATRVGAAQRLADVGRGRRRPGALSGASPPCRRWRRAGARAPRAPRRRRRCGRRACA
jgi:hypothetical protein